VTVTGSGGTGGAYNETASGAGSGGGAGGTAIGYLKLSPATTVSISVGKRPAIATAGNNGNDGNLSSFGSYMTAYGGYKGPSSGSGGAGGEAVGGTINIIGGQGSDQYDSYTSNEGGASFFGGGTYSSKTQAPYGAGGSGWRSYGGGTGYGVAGIGVVIIEYY
jgi:hypothetical protein